MIGVTGASGHFGRFVVESLLARGREPGEIVAIARSPERIGDLAGRGVDVRYADYSKPETLPAAVEGVRRLLLVSGDAVGERVRQHRNVIAAARSAGVELLAYTSISHADTSRMRLADDHRATEEAIRDAGLPYAFLRNSWYLENYTGPLASTLEHGVILGCAGDGRVSAAARGDYAAGAAVILASEGHHDAVYELGGDEAFSMAELAAEISRQAGRPVEYRDLTEEGYAEALVKLGLPEPAARVYADADRGLARGELYTGSGDLRRLLGQPTTPLSDAITAALGR